MSNVLKSEQVCAWEAIKSTATAAIHVEWDAKLTLGIEGQDGLDGDIDALEAILLKHALDHLFPVGLGVHGRLSQHDLGVPGVNFELLVEGVIPQVTHVRPVLDDTVLHGVGHLEDRSQFGGLVAHHDIPDCHISNRLFCTQDRATDD